MPAVIFATAVLVGISNEEYEQRWDAILARFGTSMSTPTGWSDSELFFSCKKPPIVVTVGSRLTAEQREATILRAERKYDARES
jgi:hypothetical protein